MDTLSSSHIDVFAHFHSTLARRRARAHDRFARPRRQRRRAPRGLRRVRGRRPPRRPRARGRRQVQEGLRRGARDRDPRAVAGPHPRGRRPPGRAVAGAALRAPARGQGRAGRGRAAPDRPARRTSRSSRSSPPSEQWRYRNKVEFSFGAGADGELVCGFHAPGRWNDIVPMDDCMLVSERVNELRRAGAARSAHRAYMPWDRRDQRGFLRNLVIREGRRTGQTQVRLVTSPGKLDVDGFIDAVDADGLWWTQTADLGESTYGGETTLLAGAPAARRAAQRPGLPDLARGVLPDQHRDGREALRRRDRLRGAARHREGLRPLLGHRHDRAVAWPPAPARSSAWRSSSPPSPTRSRTPASTRSPTPPSTRATRAWRCASSSSARASPTSRSSTRRARASRRRSSAGSSTPRPSRIVYVSCNPTTLAPNAAQLVEAGYRAQEGPPGRHVPADAAHRVRRAAGSRPGRGQEPRPRLADSAVRLASALDPSR